MSAAAAATRMTSARSTQQHSELLGLTKEMADWITTTLELSSPVAELFADIKSGVLLCKLLERIGGQPKYKSNPTPGTFYERDNVSVFLKALPGLGVASHALFDTEDLIDNKNPRQVLLCLVQVAKMMARRHNIRPPEVVLLEMQLEDRADSENALSSVDSDEDLSDGEAADPWSPPSASPVRARSASSASTGSSMSSVSTAASSQTNKSGYSTNQTHSGAAVASSAIGSATANVTANVTTNVQANVHGQSAHQINHSSTTALNASNIAVNSQRHVETGGGLQTGLTVATDGKVKVQIDLDISDVLEIQERKFRAAQEQYAVEMRRMQEEAAERQRQQELISARLAEDVRRMQEQKELLERQNQEQSRRLQEDADKARKAQEDVLKAQMEMKKLAEINERTRNEIQQKAEAYARDMAAAQAKHNADLAKEREANAELLKRTQSEHASVLRKTIENAKTDAERAQQLIRAKEEALSSQKQANQRTVDDLQKQIKEREKAAAEQENKFSVEVRQLNEEHKNYIQTITTQIQEEKDHALRAYDIDVLQRLEDAERAFSEVLNELQLRHENDLLASRARHEAELHDLRKRVTENQAFLLEQRRAEHAERVEVLQASHRSQLDALKAQHRRSRNVLHRQSIRTTTTTTTTATTALHSAQTTKTTHVQGAAGLALAGSRRSVVIHPSKIQQASQRSSLKFGPANEDEVDRLMGEVLTTSPLCQGIIGHRVGPGEYMFTRETNTRKEKTRRTPVRIVDGAVYVYMVKEDQQGTRVLPSPLVEYLCQVFPPIA